jgi:tetratricopeptide (TPR) repeat protein
MQQHNEDGTNYQTTTGANNTNLFGGDIYIYPPTLAKLVGTPQNLPRSGVVKFISRDRLSDRLHTQLQTNDRIAVTAISGMGGIGKTELALQYAITQFQQGQYPAGVCWLGARGREIAIQIITFAKVNLGITLPERLEIDKQVAHCWQYWPEGEVLIIIDGVTSYNEIAPHLPPPNPRFKLLITTRSDLGSTVKKVIVEELDEKSAIDLLESLTDSERIQIELNEAKMLCKWVGYLPLALELLGRFLSRKPDWKINRLLKALEDKRLDAKALITPEEGMTGQLGVFAALELSWQELREPERDLACKLGIFAFAPIPWSLVERCLVNIAPDDLEDTRDYGLIAHSLLKRVGEGNYQLHQIVQEFFRAKLDRHVDRGQNIKINFCQVMVEVAKAIKQTPIIDEINYLISAIPHLEEVVNYHASGLLDDDLVFHFEGIGNFYRGSGNYILAEFWYGDCLEKIQKRVGKEHLAVAKSLDNLATIYRIQGKYKQAEPLLKRALKQRKQLLGEEHLDVAVSLASLAILYRVQGEYKKAEPLYEEVLEMRRRFLGKEHPDVAKSLNSLAVLYSARGRDGDAELLYRETLEMRKQILGEEHPDVINTQCNLGNLYRELGRYKEAEPLLIDTLEKKKKLFGENHYLITTSLSNLGNLYRELGKYKEAEALLIDALEKRQHLFGEDHPSVARSMNYLGMLYSDLDMLKEAEELCFKALQQRERILVEDHPSVARSQWSLGLIYQKQGRHLEAETLYKLALATTEDKLGPNHPHTQGIQEALDSLPQIQIDE